jgi:aldehyde dehydrogenase (NAD+)
MANSRIYVHESIAEKFIESFKKSFADIKSGDPLLPTTQQGPQADELQYKQVHAYIEEAKRVGKLAMGGEPSQHENGFFVPPTVFLETAEDAKPMKEEIFGPVVHINTFRDKDVSRALRMAKKLDSGSVGVNCTSPTGAKDMPFGGYKASGIGREGWTVSINNYLETKSVLISVDDE